jgi:hypothetical protein
MPNGQGSVKWRATWDAQSPAKARIAAAPAKTAAYLSTSPSRVSPVIFVGSRAVVRAWDHDRETDLQLTTDKFDGSIGPSHTFVISEPSRHSRSPLTGASRASADTREAASAFAVGYGATGLEA